MKSKNLLASAGILLLVFGAGFSIGLKSHKNAPNSEPIVKTDTVIIRDTLIDYKPREITIPKGYQLIAISEVMNYEKTIARFRDSLLARPAIVERHDTAYIAVPMVERIFTDGKTYECSVYGYNPQMIWHKSIQEKQVITTEAPVAPKWALSPYISAISAEDIYRLEVGLRLDFWQGRWQFSPSIGYGTGIKPGWSAGFVASYNLIRK